MGRDGESKILFPTMKPLDMPKKADKAEAAPAEVKKEEVIDFSKVEIEPLFADQVDFDTFSKSDFRAVKIKACEAVKKSKKLLQFVLDDGTGEDRIILSGIHEYYEPEELVGKTAIAIVNLPPRKMMGIDYTIIWRYFSWTNQTLAMIVLWAASMYLFYDKKNYWITAVPATFMSAVSVTYFLLGNECLGQFLNSKTADGATVYNTAVAYPIGIIAAALFLGIFLYTIKKRHTQPHYETLHK